MNHLMKRLIPILLGIMAFPICTMAKINGSVESVAPSDAGAFKVSGWACGIGNAAPVEVKIFFDKPSGSDVPFKVVRADLAGEPKVRKFCGTANTAHYFNLEISAQDVRHYGASFLHVYANAPGRKTSTALARSGEFQLPSGALQTVDCRTWNGIVDRNTVLAPGCIYKRQIFFTKPNLTLDCNGAVIDGTEWLSKVSNPSANPEVINGTLHQGIGVASAKSECENAAVSNSYAYFPDSDGSGAIVRNCNIQNFQFGVYFNRRVWMKRPSTKSCFVLSDSMKVRGKDLDLEKYISDAKTTREKLYPHNITLRNVSVTNVRQDGIFVNEYAQNWLLSKVSSTSNPLGIYLERESSNTNIVNSMIRDNLNVGIAVDSSAKNMITGNLIENNGQMGIALYKNCGEGGGVPRIQHSDFNIIVTNTIRGHNRPQFFKTLTTQSLQTELQDRGGVGIWVASRQGQSTAWLADIFHKRDVSNGINPPFPTWENGGDPCTDPEYIISGEPYNRDFSKYNVITNNVFEDNALANVILEDDANVVSKNSFSTTMGNSTAADVILGSAFRGALAQFGPVKDCSVTENKSTSRVLIDSIVTMFGSDRDNNLISGNNKLW